MDERGREARREEDKDRGERDTEIEREIHRENRESGWESNHTLKTDHCQPEQ